MMEWPCSIQKDKACVSTSCSIQAPPQLPNTTTTIHSHFCVCIYTADAKAAVAKAEADLNSAKAVKISTGKKLYLAQSNAGTYDKVISQNKSIIQQEENKIALEKERAAKQAQKEKEARDKAAKDAAERAKKEKKKQEELAKKKQKVMKELQEKKAKAAANEKKRIQALEKQKKEALARAEKAKKEEAKRIAEARKKEIKNKEKYIGQLKKAESNMKSQRKSSKAIQEIESRISAEQEQLLKLKTMK
jgi:selenocysteine-specific translation elongation factor